MTTPYVPDPSIPFEERPHPFGCPGGEQCVAPFGHSLALLTDEEFEYVMSRVTE